MREIRHRTPSESDWSAILDLANRSIADVEGATTQEVWASNRRAFAGEQEHWVAEDGTTGELVGYASIERRSPDDPGVRIFVVTEPARRADVGDHLLSHALEIARHRGEPRAWLIEFAADDAFLTFLSDRGFREARRFALAHGAAACVMTMELQA